MNYKQLFTDCSPQVLVYSDESKFACGAHIMLNKAIAHRMWAKHEVSKSSTWREIKAIHFSLLSFLPFLRHKRVFWHTDNKNTVSTVLKGGNKADIHSVALDIFSCCLQNRITLCPVWIPRSENELADKISKICDYDDWFVSQSFFIKIDRLWEPHTIDRFANSCNTKLTRFNSLFWCPGTEAADAFSQDWSADNNWLVPPIFLIASAIKYIIACKGHRSVLAICSLLAFTL